MHDTSRRLNNSAGYCALLVLLIVSLPLSAKEACKFSYLGSPESLNGKTINVDDSMVAMSEVVHVNSLFSTDTVTDTPAIFFVIDNSGSMGGGGSQSSVTDVNGNRFTVTRAFIDTILARFPGAEVGVSVFGSTLWFDPNDAPYFVACPAQSQGAYVPLLKLNMAYAQYGNKTGYQILQQVLDTAYYTSTGQNPNYPYVSLRYRPTNTGLRGTSTNINAGFDAVRCAMASSSRPPANQFVIFLSDGEANVGNPATAFTSATRVPTTFTIYFTTNNTVPGTITTFTTNVKANNYSTNNANSAAWAFYNTTFANLMNLLVTNVVPRIVSQVTASPTQITVNTQTQTTWTNQIFTFPNLFPLTGQTTPFTFQINYQVKRNNVVVKDTVHTINFSVKTVPGTVLSPSEYDVRCWDRNLHFMYRGATIAAATQSMNSIDLRFDFDPGVASYAYTTCQVELSNVRGTRDRETVTLTKGAGNFFTGSFNRAVAATPTVGNNILEHTEANDSIIAVFRNKENPALPLDTLRISIPYKRVDLSLAVSNDTIHAGDTANILGWVIQNHTDTLLQQRDSLSWVQVPPVNTGDALAPLRGAVTRFTATEAWDNGKFRTVQITVSVVNPYNRYDTLKATGSITILPDGGQRFYIERPSDTGLFASDLMRGFDFLHAHPLSIITMDSSETLKYAYAVVRDRFGNFVRLSGAATIWTSLEPDTVGASAKTVKDISGVGELLRMSGIRQGSSPVVVSEPNVLPDTVLVELRFDKLLEIRLFDAATGQRVDTIRMNTDQTMTVIAKGRWSTTPTVWSEVNGSWTINPNNIQFAIPVPSGIISRWDIDPITSGTTMLTVSSYGASVTVPVFITEAPPSKLTLILLTNPDSCYAGVPIKIGAYIENKDGSLDGPWTGSSVYHDFLDNSLRSFLPWLTVNGRAVHDSLDKALAELWMNGADTILLTLYYAPLDPDSMHQIQLSLNTNSAYGTLAAKTIQFHLKPGPLDSIQIEDQYGHHLTQTQTLTAPTGFVDLFVGGFDRYGNRLEPGKIGGDSLKTAQWWVDGTLDRLEPDSVTVGPNVSYNSNSVMYDEQGNMWVRVIVGTDTLRNFVPIKIVPPATVLSYGITRDLDGDGFIDCVELYFSKNIALTPADTGHFTMRYPRSNPARLTTSPATGITKISDNAYAVTFREDSGTAAATVPPSHYPQTAWKPTIEVDTNTLGLATATGVSTIDGCPPVIWDVVKTVADQDRRHDTVAVAFSEKISGTSGAQFQTSNSPFQTFNVFVYDSVAGRFDTVPLMLNGINSFSRQIRNDSLVYFAMSNGEDLYDKHWLNIKTNPSATLKDQARGNIPAPVNKKVRVRVQHGPAFMVIVPNPAGGTFIHVAGGDIPPYHMDQAREWVRTEHRGVVISLTNIRKPDGYNPGVSSTWPAAYVKIYDVVGNIVNSVKIPNLLARVDSTGTGLTIDLYWNGANKQGMMVAPGIYRTVAYIDYPATDKTLQDQKLYAKVGISR